MMKSKRSINVMVDERKIANRVDELTDFYRHLNQVVENMIEKFSHLEKVTNKFMKT